MDSAPYISAYSSAVALFEVGSATNSGIYPSEARFLLGINRDCMASGCISHVLLKINFFRSNSVISPGARTCNRNGLPQSKHARATSLVFGQTRLTGSITICIASLRLGSNLSVFSMIVVMSKVVACLLANSKLQNRQTRPSFTPPHILHRS